MPINIQIARNSLPSMWWMIGGMNAIVLAVFLFTLFKDHLSTNDIFLIIASGGCIGFLSGIYYTYRSDCGVIASLSYLMYVVLAMEYIFCSGVATAAMQFAGRPDLKWFAVLANSLSMTITLVGGIYLEARRLKLCNTSASSFWRDKLGEYIHNPSHKLQPESILSVESDNNRMKFSIPIIAVGSTNIPLLFELIVGGRMNAIFFAMPLLACTFAYINIKGFGPSMLRMILLRRLEKSVGYRFINSDLEQIQELRRTFFLSRWLMKDYVNPTSKAAANVAVQRK